MLWLLALAGCDRVDCTPLDLPRCAPAAICCPFRDDLLAGDCYIQQQDPACSGRCTLSCSGMSCDQAFEDYGSLHCQEPPVPEPAPEHR